MQLPAIAVAASLLIGPAPAGVDQTPEPSPAASTEKAAPLPDVNDPVDAEPELEREPEPEPDPDPPTPTVEEPESAPLAAPVVRDRLGCNGNKSCRKMSVAGIVVGTIGLAAVGTGIGLVVKRDEVIPESPTYVTSTHPAGTVTLTIGAGVTLTAVLMLIAAHRGYKQRRDEARRVEPLANGLRF